MLRGKKSRVWLIAGLVLLFSGMVVAPSLVWAESKTVIGTVAADGDDIVLKADDGVYILEGEVEGMVGKKVTATGEVSKNEAGKMVLEVAEIAETK